MKQLVISIAFMATTLLLGSAPRAHANLQVCNQTLEVVNVALGGVVNKEWESTGWWTIGPNQCANVISETLGARYYYIYARDVFNRTVLDGKYPMCVDPGEFQIKGHKNCLVRGHVSASFAEIDTRRSERWTIYLQSE